MKVLQQGGRSAYEEYAPMDRWIGSGLAFGVGALLVGVSRASRPAGLEWSLRRSSAGSPKT
ncbi:hypothetical protein GCM10027053_35980 [Intrasporangium mesophilum]